MDRREEGPAVEREDRRGIERTGRIDKIGVEWSGVGCRWGVLELMSPSHKHG